MLCKQELHFMKKIYSRIKFILFCVLYQIFDSTNYFFLTPKRVTISSSPQQYCTSKCEILIYKNLLVIISYLKFINFQAGQLKVEI